MRRRYRQVKQDDGTFKMVEIGGVDSPPVSHGPSITVGDFNPYRSPIDGSVVTSERQHRDHKERHGVVEHREFGTEHWKPKPAAKPDKMARKREINEIINAHIDRAR